MTLSLPSAWSTDTLSSVDPGALARNVVPAGDVLRALRYVGPAEVRVVILGQDPYPTPGKACGLAFGVATAWAAATNYRPHSSFGNLLTEVAASGFAPPTDWSLEGWASQGVLLLNTRLGVDPGAPMSQAGLGWEAVVAEVLGQLPNKPIIWLAWGREARRVAARHAKPQHRVLATSHPCKFSATRGSRLAPAFLGSRCFETANQWLVAQGRAPVDWSYR